MLRSSLTYGALLLLSAAPLYAQDTYGAARLSFGQSETAGAPIALRGADGSQNWARADLRFGTVLDAGTYLQADLGLSVTDNAEKAPNTANKSTSLVLRAGRQNGALTYGGFLGALSSDHDNDASDKAQRFLVGIEGAFELSPRWSMQGHLGYLTGTGGSDSIATVTDGFFTGAGVNFAATEQLRLGSSIGYLNAKMGATGTAVELWTFDLRAEYDLNALPGLSLFAAVQYGESHQKERIRADDITDTTTLMAGLTYRFGAQGKTAPKTSDLTYLEAYLGNTGGILE